MGNISKYSQGKLASQAVGVANVRNTGVDERNAAVARLGNVVSGIADNYLAKEAAVRNTANKVAAQKQAIDFQARTNGIRRTVRQAYADNPAEYEAAFRKDFDKLQSGMASTIKDQEQRSMFMALTQSTYNVDEELAHTTRQFKLNTLTDTGRVIDKINDFSAPGSAPQDPADMSERVSQVVSLVSSTGLTEEEFPHDKKKQVIEDAYNKHVAAFSRQQEDFGDPLAVAAAIERGEFTFKYTLDGREYSYSPYADTEVRSAKMGSLQKKSQDVLAQTQFNRDVASYDILANLHSYQARVRNGVATLEDHAKLEQEFFAIGSAPANTDAERKEKSALIAAYSKVMNPIVAHPKESDAQALATGYTYLRKALGMGGSGGDFDAFVKATKTGVPLSANPNLQGKGIFAANPSADVVKSQAELVAFLVDSGHLLSQSEYDVLSQAANPYGVGLPDENKDKRYKLMYDIQKGTAPKFKLGSGEYTVNSSNINQVILAEGYAMSKDFGPARKAEAEVFRTRFFRYAVTDLELHMKKDGGVSDYDALPVDLQQQVLDTVLKDAYRQAVISTTGRVPTTDVQIKPRTPGSRMTPAEQRARVAENIKALRVRPAAESSSETGAPLA